MRAHDLRLASVARPRERAARLTTRLTTVFRRLTASARRHAVPALLSVVLFTMPVRAHGGPGMATRDVDTPTWLFLLTGGGVIAVSFLLTSFVTDRDLLTAYHERRLPIPGGERICRWGGRVGRGVGLLGLVAVLVVGIEGPPEAARNFAVLFVWVVWWAGFTASTYLVGNAWPALDPFGRLAGALPDRGAAVTLPEWVGRWPAVAGLLVLVWLEVVTEMASDPGQLAGVVAVYVVVSIAGSALLGRETWRRQIDPVTGVFELYGRMAPVQRTDDGLELAAPGAALIETDATATARASEIGFVIALLWVTSFDGFVATPRWRDLAAPVVTMVPAELVYFVAMLVGYGLFLGVYWWASKLVRRSGRTYRSTPSIATAFAPTLVPIAAGYHLGHYLPYFLGQLPAAVVVATSPLSPPLSPPVLALPNWVHTVGPVAVLAGHLLAVWIAHSRSFELFTGKLQPIRSQYPYVVVMVLYTITGLWLLSQPSIDAPFL